MLLASAVVVWEWLNEHGRWRPYSPAVSHHIEAVIRNDPRGGSVVLGQVDTRLSPYIVDLHSMHQFRQDTGKTNVIDSRDIGLFVLREYELALRYYSVITAVKPMMWHTTQQYNSQHF